MSEGTNDDNKKTQGAMEALMSAIPDYRELLKDPVKNAEKIKQIDEIIENTDITNAGEALTWGSKVYEQINAVTESLERDMASEDRAAVAAMVNGVFESMKDTEALSQAAMSALKKGQNAASFVGRNKWAMGGTALAATGSLFIPVVGPFVAAGILGAGGLATGAKEMGRKKRMNTGTDAEAIAHRVGQALESFDSRIKDLEKAEQKIPGMIQRAETLSTESLKAFVRLTILVSAGKEIQRRLEETVPNMPTTTVEELEQREQVIAFSQSFGQRLAFMNQSRAGFAAKREQMKTSKQTLLQDAHNIKSLLTSELDNAKFDLQVASANTRAMAMSNNVLKTRMFIHGIRKDAQSAVETGAKMSEEGRADHAKQFQAQTDILQRNINWMKEARQRQEKFEADKKAAQQQMESKVTEMIDLRKEFDTAETKKKTGKDETKTATPLQTSFDGANDNTPAPTEKKPKLTLKLGGGIDVQP